MNIMIVGSRSINDYDFVLSKINHFLSLKNINKNDITIISGGANGVDKLAKRFAIDENININEYLPDWKQFGRGAGIKRNVDMLNVSDYVLCFWDNKSKGTKFNIDYCKKHNIDIEVILIQRIQQCLR